jgi:hypothetical protein
LKLYDRFMIAPDGCAGKGLARALRVAMRSESWSE